MPAQTTSKTPTETITAITITKLKLSSLNPRAGLSNDQPKVLELAESIAQKGVLQNLIVRPSGKSFEIVAGERRFRAVMTLVEAKRLPKTFTLPCLVKDVSDLELIEIATAENADREDMHPLDEALAFATMVELGRTPEDIAERQGKSVTTVQKRLAIINFLCDEAKQTFRMDAINLAQAQALTRGSDQQQQDLLKAMQSWHLPASEIRRRLERAQMLVENAIFDLDEYSGQITNNLFADQEDCFLDTEQAWNLQHKAMQALKDKFEQTWSWVLMGSYFDIDSYKYGAAAETNPKDAEQGVLIVYAGDGKVKVSEGMTLREHYRKDSKTTKDTPKPKHTKKMLEQVSKQKTQALQTAVAANARTSFILAIMGLLGSREVKLSREQGIKRLDHPIKAMQVQRQKYQFILEETKGSHADLDDHLELHPDKASELELYSYLKAQVSDDLQALFCALVSSAVGSWHGEGGNYGDSLLACAIASDLNVDMREHFTLDDEHLKGYRKPGLEDLAGDLGVTLQMDVPARLIREYLLTTPQAVGYVPPVATFFKQDKPGEAESLRMTPLLADFAKAA